MKSKIEKTEWKCPACGTTKITPWYVKELESELEGIYPETVKKIIEKVGKMLNDNSQDQEENEPEKVYVDPIVPDFIAEKLAEERYNTREILLNGTKPLEVEDTPEEWVCPKCGFDDCYPYKNSEDFGLDYCPICSELVKLTTK